MMVVVAVTDTVMMVMMIMIWNVCENADDDDDGCSGDDGRGQDDDDDLEDLGGEKDPYLGQRTQAGGCGHKHKPSSRPLSAGQQGPLLPLLHVTATSGTNTNRQVDHCLQDLSLIHI